MADAPDAAVSAPAPQTEQTPTTNPEPAQAPEQPQAPDMHGFTSEQLADMRKFYDANGGYDKVKSRISNPPKPEPTSEPQPQAEPQNLEPTSQPNTPEVPKTPQGAITPSEFLAEQYFRSLAGEEKYASISEGIKDGAYLKEMSAFGIQPLNPDGSINDQKVRMYLDLKAQTVPAAPTGAEPNASNAPTVTYTEVGEDGISNLDQAYKIIMESGNPNSKAAEDYIRAAMNPDSSKKK